MGKDKKAHILKNPLLIGMAIYGIAGLIMSPLIEFLVPKLGWAIGISAAISLIIGNIVVLRANLQDD